MPDPVPSTDWPQTYSAAIGRRVAKYRRARGLSSAQALADLLHKRLGLSMNRSAIGDIESGKRKAIAVWELLALAFVLDVPPLLLALPIGEDDVAEPLPGLEVDPWDAAQWITGEGPPPGGGIPPEQWRRTVDLLQLYREHAAKEAEWRQQTQIVVVGDSREEVDRLFERALARRREIEDALRLIRRAIRGRGDLPPALPPELAHLDDGEPAPRLRPTDEAPDTTDAAGIEERRARRRQRRERQPETNEEGTGGSTEDQTDPGR